MYYWVTIIGITIIVYTFLSVLDVVATYKKRCEELEAKVAAQRQFFIAESARIRDEAISIIKGT